MMSFPSVMKVKSPATRNSAAALALVFALVGCAQRQPTSPLSGTVTSAEEGHMEGVLVSAKEAGGHITVTVVSDRDGHYAFPASRLHPGTYRISIRAVGYDLDGNDTFIVSTGAPVHADLKLQKTTDLSSQLTDAEWLMSVPGTEKEKNLLYRCSSCHTLAPVVKSKYDAKAWMQTLVRMQVWVPPSTLDSPIPAPTKVEGSPASEFAQYLSTINLSGRLKWTYELKTFSRPSGDATKAVITEYDLPGPSVPHDAVVDREGMVWYNDFQRPLFGRLDPHTGETKEWNLPVLKPGFPQGLLTIKLDHDGNPWLPRFFQGCTLTKYDRKTGRFVDWKVSPQYEDKLSRCAHVALGAPDGTVWFSDSGNRRMFRLDPGTGRIDVYESFPDYTAAKGGIETAGRPSTGHRTYGIAVDSQSNGYFADIAGGTIGQVDAKTGKVTLYPTPTPDSGPRRTFMDSQDRLWFGENYASKLGRFDTRTKQFREWTPPVPWSGAYPAVVDKAGSAWTVGMSTDYIYRLDPRTNQFTMFLLPQLGANLRKVDADNSTTPASIWVAEVHRGKLARLEPAP
jgi:virginiamycin B lyase